MGEIVSIEIKAWWLLLMPFLLMFSLIVISLIMKRSSNYKVEEGNGKKTLTSWITKKDVLYWLLIICLGTISILTYQYKGYGEIISHWGFAGTIVSIILAVVAIGFTLFQTLSSNLSSEKIASSADKIEQATLDLDSETLVKSSRIINESAEFLKSRISLIDDKLTSINNAQEALNEIAATGFGKASNGHSDSSLGIDIDMSDINVFIEKVLPGLAYYSQLYTYSCLVFYKNNIDIGTRDDILYKITFGMTNYDRNNEKSESPEEYLKGANMASEGATRTFIVALGIKDKFMTMKEDEQNKYIDKCKSNLRLEHVKLIDDIGKEFLN